MTLSTVIAVRDGEAYLEEALASVLREPEVDEVVVVDDGSSDRTSAILEAHGDRLVVVRQAPAGAAAALNRGVTHATGDLLAFQDADDVWSRGRTAALLRSLTDDVDVVFGWIEQFASPDLEPCEVARLRIDARPQPAYLLQTMLVRRAAFDRVGTLQEDLITSANIDWISRARHAGLRTAMVPEVVTRRRIHATNLGRRAAATRDADLLRVLRAHLERGRRGDRRP